MKCGNKTVQKYTDDFIEKAMQIEDVTETDLLHDYLRGLPTDIRLAVKRRGVTGLEAVMIVADEEDQLIRGKRADRGGHAVQQRNTDGPAPMEIDRLHMGVGNPPMQPQGPVVPSGLAPSTIQYQQMWQSAARPVTDFLLGLWGSQRQN
uniref:Retrotransposon gag domain-containing protein n=1 Tax=Chromera velia CCMP2878 TaxID=1169474 RepID=A0A0K6S688_9ALVE|eukprot:Cvel_147.t1-p1 / transcript=Cvel_147.t1 / gene=Cvel_147 / organism=Chromera_velia_CCMP2878 / gene_product=hypothetical protein / transcript_product=hypothetical protein / location=Cvel_scaffold10:6363-7025(+) / protein_length=148 / sequence_SO=supercontig / SO=protein_coding / is_pseudo=false